MLYVLLYIYSQALNNPHENSTAETARTAGVGEAQDFQGWN